MWVRLLSVITVAIYAAFGCLGGSGEEPAGELPAQGDEISINWDSVKHVVIVATQHNEKLVSHVVKPDHRPYLHPIRSLRGDAILTEFSPGHHRHQTGVYWGFTRLNGRDFFHHPEASYWQRRDVKIIQEEGSSVRWLLRYGLMADDGRTLMEETQIWTCTLDTAGYYLDLEWQGRAVEHLTISAYDYGGLFIRMPWSEEGGGRVVNAARQINEQAEGQRAMWLDVGMPIDGLNDWGHIAIFDHPHNADFPVPWRVDGQLGVGPSRSRLGDWQIPKGHTEIIKHRLYIYSGVMNDVDMTARWNDFIGSQSIYSDAALWGLAQQEGRNAEFLDPDEAVDAMTVNEGFSVNVFAADPTITQPMAFCWDDQGRLWVAENRDYESRSTGFSSSGDSRILILEDLDRDGTADQAKVFAEDIPFPAALAVGLGGLFVGAPPNLLFIPDRDRDDRGDMEDIEVRLTGWGIRDRHETLNSFHWGPDGWLYGCEGFATSSKVRKPKGQGRLYRPGDEFPEDILDEEGVDINGGVWRYHPIKDRFEVVAHGFSNPWGIDYDAKGQLFISACVIPHLFHVVPGGIYHRQGGRHFNPFIYSDIQTIVDHRHRSAHGGARIYQSDAFPPAYHGHVFMANIHEHAVLEDVLRPKGSGFVAEHGSDFLLANNAQWIGFSLEIGPDGALYILDWHDADICGKEVLQKETGRVFRVESTQKQAGEWPGRFKDLSSLSDLELLALQTSSSDWHSRRSRIILQGRAFEGLLDAATKGACEEQFSTEQNPDHRLRYLWTGHLIEAWPQEKLIQLLDDEDPYIRSWTIQFLLEDSLYTKPLINRLEQLAAVEPSPVVRLYLASALQRIPVTKRWAILSHLVKYSEDATDHNIPKMLWFAIEPMVSSSPDSGLALAAMAEIPLLANFIARRLVDGDQLDELITILPNTISNKAAILQGLSDALDSRPPQAVPVAWQATAAKLSRDSSLVELVHEISQKFIDAESARDLLHTLSDGRSNPQEISTAIGLLARRTHPDLPAILPVFLEDPEVRLPAIKAIAYFDQPELGKLILEQFADLDLEEKEQALLTMASRPRYGRLLTEALDNGEIEKREVPVYIARQLRRVVGNGFVEVWGPIDETSVEIDKEYLRYRALLIPHNLENADRASGRDIFDRLCRTCHQLDGQGGLIGPDLTGSNRSNIEYLLGNLVEPSADIQDDYLMTIITTRDGRTYVGTVGAESNQSVRLHVVGGDPVVIQKSSIQSREQSDVSMMPSGLLNTLSDQSIINLVAFLRDIEG